MYSGRVGVAVEQRGAAINLIHTHCSYAINITVNVYVATRLRRVFVYPCQQQPRLRPLRLCVFVCAYSGSGTEPTVVA